MATPFLGEIKLVSWSFAARGWAFCNGALLPIANNQALFALLGTSYGGNGVNTFALPDLRGRVPLHCGTNSGGCGAIGGQATYTLLPAETPMHTHAMNGTKEAGTVGTVAAGQWLGGMVKSYGPLDPANAGTMNSATISTVGGNAPHENRQPYTALNYVIAMQGIFPSRN